MLDESHGKNSHRKRRYRLALAAAVTAPALILATSGVAQAGTTPRATHRPPPLASPQNCPGSTLCTYENAGFNNNGTEGTQWNFSYSRVPHLVWFYVGGAVNDKISSLYNNRAWVTYVNKDCPAGQDTIAFAGQAEVEDFSSWSWPEDGTGVNDSISALAFGTSPNTQNILHGSC